MGEVASLWLPEPAELFQLAALGERGTLAEAARLLGCSTSTVSRTVTRVERRLGIAMLSDVKPVGLTNPGLGCCLFASALINRIRAAGLCAVPLRQLVAVKEVHFTESMHRAARRLHVTPQAVSRTVAKVEAVLGAAIFQRSPTGTLATTRGARIIEEIEDILLMIRKLPEWLNGTPVMEASRPIRMAGQSRTLIGIVHQIRERWPHVEFSYCQLSGESIIDKLARRKVDVAQIYTPEGQLPSDLRCITLVREPSFAILPVNHPLFGAESIRLEYLRDDDWVLDLPGTMMHDLVVKACRDAGFRPHIAFSAEDRASVEEMVRVGGCVTLGSPLSSPSPFWRAVPLEQEVVRLLRLAWADPMLSMEVVSWFSSLVLDWYRDRALECSPEYARKALFAAG